MELVICSNVHELVSEIGEFLGQCSPRNHEIVRKYPQNVGHHLDRENPSLRSILKNWEEQTRFMHGTRVQTLSLPYNGRVPVLCQQTQDLIPNKGKARGLAVILPLCQAHSE